MLRNPCEEYVEPEPKSESEDQDETDESFDFDEYLDELLESDKVYCKEELVMPVQGEETSSQAPRCASQKAYKLTNQQADKLTS